MKVPGIDRAAFSGVPSAMIFWPERQALKESFRLGKEKLAGQSVMDRAPSI
jgi:hypothetical protein